MREFLKYGSVRGAAGNSRPYRDAHCFRNELSSSFLRHHQLMESATLQPRVFDPLSTHA